MEEELESAIVNATLDEEVYHPSYYYYFLHGIITIICGVLGMVSDAIIVYTIARCKILHTKTFIILMNYCINDFLFLLIFPCGSFFLHGWLGHCLREAVIVCSGACMILIFLLLINPLMTRDNITVKSILLTLYIPMFALIFLKVLLCALHIHTFVAFESCEFVLVYMYSILLLIMVIFEVITLCKKKFSVVDENYTFRFNLCRIYTYNLLILFVFTFIMKIRNEILDMIGEFLITSILLTGHYMLLYIVNNDKNFKMCLMRLFTGNKYSVDATLNSEATA